jgi:hypothetical protein
MAPQNETRRTGGAAGLGETSFPGGNDNRDNSPPSLVAPIKIAPLQQDFAAGLSRATATSCILGVDPGFPAQSPSISQPRPIASRPKTCQSSLAKSIGRAEAALLALYGFSQFSQPPLREDGCPDGPDRTSNFEQDLDK